MNQKSELPQSFCVRKLKVLADTTRLAVLQSLMEEPKHVGELNAAIGVEQSLLSHHLKVLRRRGLSRQRDMARQYFTLWLPQSNGQMRVGQLTLAVASSPLTETNVNT
jgi:DNA-binding transcriptional ArsR family regulator